MSTGQNIVELRQQAQQLRRMAELERAKIRLFGLSSQINGCDVCKERAGDDAMARTCEAAADAILAWVDAIEHVHRELYGLPPQPERPRLRVVEG